MSSLFLTRDIVIHACEEKYSRRKQLLEITDNESVGVRGDKTCEVNDGIRVIVLGNFVESLAQRGHEIKRVTSMA